MTAHDAASLFPAFLALVASIAALLAPRVLRQAPGRPDAVLRCYTGLMVPAIATALALAHLHSDYGSHDLPCLPVALLGAMVVLALSFVAGFALQQWKLLRRLAAWSVPAPAPLTHSVDALAARLGAVAPGIFLVEVDRPVALTVGVFKPRIYLSTWYLNSLGSSELEGVLAHELAHVVRRDNLWALVATAFLGATVCLPTSWQAVEALLAERELAADGLAVAVTGKPIALARSLVKAHASGALHFGPVASGLGDRVEDRLNYLLRLHEGATPEKEALRTEPRRLLAATLVAPLFLGWLIFELPHLLRLP